MFRAPHRRTAVTGLRTFAALLALVALGLVPAGSALAADPAATPAVAELLPACTTANDPAPMQEYGQWKSTFLNTGAPGDPQVMSPRSWSRRPTPARPAASRSARS